MLGPPNPWHFRCSSCQQALSPALLDCLPFVHPSMPSPKQKAVWVMETKLASDNSISFSPIAFIIIFSSRHERKIQDEYYIVYFASLELKIMHQCKVQDAILCTYCCLSWSPRGVSPRNHLTVSLSSLTHRRRRSVPLFNQNKCVPWFVKRSNPFRTGTQLDSVQRPEQLRQSERGKPQSVIRMAGLDNPSA